MPRRQREGVSLTEVMVVMVIIAILAMVVIPRFTRITVVARESRLRTSLEELRSSVETFRANMGGHPANLEHLMHDHAPGTCRVPPDGRPLKCFKADWRGPYLATTDGKLPRDPIEGKRKWRYDKKTGEVSSKSKKKALDGTPYSNW